MATFLYTTRADRERIIQQQEGLGLVMVHDDFGVGPEGENQLTFELDTRTTPLDPDVTAYQAAATTEERVDIIAKRLGLTR